MKAILTGLILLMATSAWADVVGEIIGKQIDENGNIVIQTQYKIDGVEVQSRYPQDAQGRYYWQSRYSFQNFDGMTEEQIMARIDQDVKAFGESLIAKKYTAGQNSTLDLKNAIGRKVTVSTADIQVSETKAYTVRTDGTAQVKTLTPPTPEKTVTELIAEVKTAIAEVNTKVTAEAVKP